jgi:hypothetical protein
MPPNNLGQYFPANIRNESAKRNLIVGSVYKFYCTVAQKEKRMILVGIRYDQKEVAFVHINSEINVNFFRTPQLANENVKFELSEHRPYITKECFICCAQLIIKGYDEMVNLLTTRPDIHIGNMTSNDYSLVKAHIKNSKVIPRNLKKEFGLSL